MYLKLNLHIVHVKLDMKFYNSFLNPSSYCNSMSSLIVKEKKIDKDIESEN
jgi:hypothetical protein